MPAGVLPTTQPQVFGIDLANNFSAWCSSFWHKKYVTKFWSYLSLWIDSIAGDSCSVQWWPDCPHWFYHRLPVGKFSHLEYHKLSDKQQDHSCLQLYPPGEQSQTWILERANAASIEAAPNVAFLLLPGLHDHLARLPAPAHRPHHEDQQRDNLLNSRSWLCVASTEEAAAAEQLADKELRGGTERERGRAEQLVHFNQSFHIHSALAACLEASATSVQPLQPDIH